MEFKTIKRFELRVKRENLGIPYNKKINQPKDMAKIVQALCEGIDHEVFLVFLLDVQHSIIGYSQVGMGGIDSCPVDVRSVFRAAVLNGTRAIIVAHNHPSGDPTPSRHDLKLTESLLSAGKLLDIQLLDHVIVADSSCVSLAELGAIPNG